MVRKFLAVAVVAAALATAPAVGQTPHWPDYDTLQTQVYFGLHSADGSGVSEQEWATFLREVVTPRFPDGLTVLGAYGQGSAGTPDVPVLGEATKMLIVVHDNTDAAQQKFREIEAEYRTRFNQHAIFRVDFPARIAD